MIVVEQNVSLAPHNSFGIVAKARELVRVRGESDVVQLLADPALAGRPTFILGGGSNIVLTGDVRPLVLKVEVMGRTVVDDGPKATIVEIGAGENWHEAVAWSLDQGFGGLENLAMIPGTVGASPVQNVGAYGVELQDRFESLDAIDLQTGRPFTLDATQCAFGYRDSVFKHPPPDHAEGGSRGMGWPAGR
jgi:UDP-N-acetylmuramate dehydrogenase